MYNKLIIGIMSLTIIGSSYALQDIQIVGGTNAGNPKVAVVNFTGDSTEDETNVSRTIANDLSITGEFAVKQYPDATNIEPGTKYIISGAVNGNTINFKLTGNEVAGKNSELLDQNVTYTTNVRKAAHTISNNTYQKITNVKGIFTTKIAYIKRSGKIYSIIISDYDGYNQKTIFSSGHPVSSLAWDNTGNLLAYVSFESGKPVVYVQNLPQAQRYVVANFNGSNSAPAFTPDGKKLAVTLSKDDHGSHIYLVNNGANTTATNILPSSFSGSIQTEASFSNNGSMVFSSNHDSGAQIFMSNLQGAEPTRLTLNLGNYNVSPRFSHDASKITFVNRNAGVLKAYLMDLSTKVSYPISLQTTQDLAPSFAPNDKLILFSSNGESIYIGNSTGTIQTRLNKISGTIIDQSWANNF